MRFLSGLDAGTKSEVKNYPHVSKWGNGGIEELRGGTGAVNKEFGKDWVILILRCFQLMKLQNKVHR